MTEIVIASAARTPVGSFNGAFASLSAQDGRKRTEAGLRTGPVPSPAVWERVASLSEPGEGPAEPSVAHHTPLHATR